MRAAARNAGVGIDAYVSVLVEYRSLCDLLGSGRVDALAETARASGCLDAVAPPELQTWHRLMAGRVAAPGDDLPTVFVPLRLAAALPPSARAEAVKRIVDANECAISHAAALEAAATVRGVLMQTWVLAQFASASGGVTTAL